MAHFDEVSPRFHSHCVIEDGKLSNVMHLYVYLHTLSDMLKSFAELIW